MKLKDKLNQISNNFSREEKIFNRKTGDNLLSEQPFETNKRAKTHLSVSIIIPTFNSHNTIVPVIKSILRQNFLKKGGKAEVIISDDYSRPPLLNKISNFKNVLNIKYIYSFKNRGAGFNRDNAVRIAKNNIIVFIDSDTIIPPFFIENHLLIHSILSRNNIVISFRENVFPPDRRIYSSQNWSHGNMNLSDHRVNMIFKSEWVMKSTEKRFIGKEFKILKETNYFKNFGFGKRYFIWTLPMMALTCAMSAPAALVKKAIPVPEQLHGWGFNDTCMAAKMIATGAKVIPNLNSTVLHILEKKHTKSNYIKNKEFLKNEKIYKKLLEQKYYE